MQAYSNLGGDSNINAYEIGDDFIRIRFKDGSIYLYDYSSAGSDKIETMKRLAQSGQGLNSYITRVVRKSYRSREL